MTRRLLPARLSRPATAALGLAVATTALSGCMYLSPTQTTESYTAADGADVQLGDVQLSNVLIVTTAKGQKGTLEGLATNNGTAPVQLAVSIGGKSSVLTIPAQTAVRLDGKPSGGSTATVPAVPVASAPAAPGALTPVTFATQANGASSLQVPVVLDQPPYGTASADHPEYTPSTSTSTTEPDG